MRIATMATGGIGGHLAARLAAGGHQVAAIARGPHLDAIRSSGLRLRTPSEDLVAHTWRITDDPYEIGPVDAVLFAVKGHALEAAAPWAAYGGGRSSTPPRTRRPPSSGGEAPSP